MNVIGRVYVQQNTVKKNRKKKKRKKKFKTITPDPTLTQIVTTIYITNPPPILSYTLYQLIDRPTNCKLLKPRKLPF